MKGSSSGKNSGQGSGLLAAPPKLDDAVALQRSAGLAASERSASGGSEPLPPWHANMSTTSAPPPPWLASVLLAGASGNVQGSSCPPPSCVDDDTGTALPFVPCGEQRAPRAAAASASEAEPATAAVVVAADWRRHCRYWSLAAWMATSTSADPAPGPCISCAAAAGPAAAPSWSRRAASAMSCGSAAKKSVRGRCVMGSKPIWMRRFLRCVFQKFLISLSVRPGRCVAIADHLLPRTECRWRIVCSSSCENLPRLMSGRRCSVDDDGEMEYGKLASCTGEPGEGPPAAMAVLLDVLQQLLVLLRRPRALLEAALVAARRPPHAGDRTPDTKQHQLNADENGLLGALIEWWPPAGQLAYILAAGACDRCPLAVYGFAFANRHAEPNRLQLLLTLTLAL
ncbi:hypothetical protein U9M48_038475 [Paspalum notatum var. saurae]|uniref:Uncharacterized protein n=1 Tax=Paspalum notatum var. saurae TaxID=547442 RepID=A0AAQ3ULK8_PASNO